MSRASSGHIIFTIDNPPPFAGGGAGKLALKLARRLREKGCSIEIITPNPHSWHVIEKEVNGVPVVFLPCGIRHPEFLFSIIYNFQMALWLIRRRHRLTAIHLRGMRGVLLLILFSKWTGIRLFVTALSESNWRLLNPFPPSNPYRWLVRTLLKDIHGFVALSHRLADVMTQEGIRSDLIVYIPNGASVPDRPSDRITLRSRLRLPQMEFIALYAGRLHWQKDIFFLLNGWKNYIQERTPSRLLLLGDGPQLNEIKCYIDKNNLTDRIFCLGYRDDVAEYLAAADVFILPSRIEGCSNALLEAMAYGLACVATDSPGNDEVIENGKSGFLVEFENLEQFQSVLTRLHDEPETRETMGQAARQRVHDSFSLEQNAQRHITLYFPDSI